MHDEWTDEALMCAFRDGDGKAFETLYGRHRAPLYRFLLRQCAAGIAEELSQDCWGNLIRARKNYEVSAKFTTWLYRIAHNRLIDHFRAHERSALARYDDVESLDAALEAVPAPAHEEPPASAERRETARRIADAVKALPAPQRETFLLHADGGLTLEEIAAATGVGRETAKSRLRYALASLRKQLREEIT